MSTYVLTVKARPWLLTAVEEALSGLPPSANNDLSKSIRNLRAQNGRPITDDELLLAYSALCDLKILEKEGSRYTLNRDRLSATTQWRLGVQAAINVLKENGVDEKESLSLCVSLPPALSPAVEHVIRESSTDLRSSLLDVVASAKQSLIIASPFWDAGTTAEMVTLAGKKLAYGVHVSILGRFSRDLPANVRSQLVKISHSPNCAVMSWIEGVGFDTETFHFKAISADRGQRAYLGSANMTVSSLRSRMELGVILSGNTALQLDRILRVVLAIAKPVSFA